MLRFFGCLVRFCPPREDGRSDEFLSTFEPFPTADRKLRQPHANRVRIEHEIGIPYSTWRGADRNQLIGTYDK